MSAYTHFKSELGEHGVFTVWMDVEGQAMNTLSTKVSSEMESILDEIESNAAIKSVVFASGKDASFIAGADIDMLEQREFCSGSQRPVGCRAEVMSASGKHLSAPR